MRYLALVLAAVSLMPLADAGCYKCEGPDCRNLPPIYPDYPASPEGACAHLAEIHCSDAKTVGGVSCPMAFRKRQELLDMKLPCLVAAIDVDAARKCGTVRCE